MKQTNMMYYTILFMWSTNTLTYIVLMHIIMIISKSVNYKEFSATYSGTDNSNFYNLQLYSYTLSVRFALNYLLCRPVLGV